MFKYSLAILLLIVISGCSNQDDQDGLNDKVAQLSKQLNEKNQLIDDLQRQVDSLANERSGAPEYWYAFKPSSTESNIVKLNNSTEEVIDRVDLIDSVDIVYTFRHTASISQIDDGRINSLLTNLRSFKEASHSSTGYGPMSSSLSYIVNVFVVCEEDGLPIETENCTDNIYILVQPTELGFENNLFRVSRLFNAEIKSLEDSKDGVILTLEHSRYPRKELKILVRPELVKFVTS